VKNIDIRRFLGYVCQIAKVRVRISFGWVSLFAQKYVFLFLCAYAHVDIKNDYQFYVYLFYVYAYIELKISDSIRVHIIR